MAGETFINGDVVIFAIHDGVDSYDPIACVTSSTLSESVEVDSVQTKCDPGNTVQTAGAYSYEITFDGLYIDEAVDTDRFSHDLLKDLMRAKTLVEWSMATGITAPTTEYGSGYITALELTGDAGENATFTGTISGTGAITATNPNP